MTDKLQKIVSGINTAWGILAMIGFLIIFIYTLSSNVEANGQKIDESMLIMKKQTEIMSSLAESLKDKDRDHIEFRHGQQENGRTQREIVRLIDRVVVLIEQGKK